jgi:hypothetical protein
MARQRLYVHDRGDCVVSDGGFSWFAALASPIWALHRRLYLLAVILAIASVISNVVGQTGQWGMAAAQVLLLGSQGNRLHRWLLERRGWRVTAEETE